MPGLAGNLRRLTPEGRAAANALSDYTLHLARPFFWHIGARNGGAPRGASMFIMQFEDRFVGVTADHVIDEYLSAKAADDRFICQIGTHQVWPERSLISRSPTLDIATFEIEENDLNAMGAVTADCRGAWPPPNVEVGDTLTLTGFLDNHRIKEGPQHYGMLAWGGHGVADAVSEREIVSVYDPETTLQAAADIDKPPLGFNLSGCSGGPVVLIKTVNGLLRWFPVGLIYKGPGDRAEGELALFDRIHIRRLNFIQPDGTIREPDEGWLPDR